MTSPAHIAIIMDGNGRWAQSRGLPRSAGHRAGVEALRQAVQNVSDSGAHWLTIYAFSSENWSRPASEISDLMGLLKLFIRRDLAQLHRNGVRVRMIGNRDTLAADILELITDAETLTRANTSMNLVIAFNYGARDEIVRAARHLSQMAADGHLDPHSITPEMLSGALDTADIPDPDLIIRTSGEQRLSNFLLWQAAYSEFVFLPCFWPDFDRSQLDHALAIYADRDRRFGAVAAREALS